MPGIKQIIENTDTKWGRAFDLTVQAMIILSLISFSMETLPNLSEQTRKILRFTEIFTVGAFTLEYIARVAAALG